MNNFEKASRLKLVFAIPGVAGQLKSENLWDLKLESLDKAAVALNKTIKETDESSFISKTSNPSLDLEKLRFEIIKYVITCKLEEKENRLKAAQKLTKANQLKALIAGKKAEALGAKSIEELEKELADIEAE